MSSEVTESSGFYEVLAWLELNKKRLIIAAAAIASVALAVSFLVWLKNQKEIEASAALLKLGSPFSTSEGAAATKAEDYLKLAKSYASTRAGERAALLAAGAYFGEQKYSEALAQFKKYQSDFSGGKWGPEAAFGIAACQESQNNIEEAIKAYQEVISRYAGEPVAGQAKLALGRLYEGKKQPELALKMYDELLRGGTRSAWSADAGERKEQLLIKYPELAPKQTNAIPPAAPLVMTNVATNAVPQAATNVIAPISTQSSVAAPTNRPVANTNAPIAIPSTNTTSTNR